MGWTRARAIGALGVCLTISLTATSVTSAHAKSQTKASNGFSVSSVKVAGGLKNPTGIAPAGDGLLITERRGRVRMWDGTKLSLFLNASGRVNASDGEQGLLDIATAPNYATSGTFFVTYTDGSGALVVARGKAVSPGGAKAKKNLKPILRIPHPKFTNHNGGSLAFGPDGSLYVSTGDGGGGGDPRHNAQSKRSRLGKILRVNPNSGNAKIWGLGLRNPWRFSFDAVGGALWIGDVGEHRFEEINMVPAGQRGANFGWSCYEGNTIFNKSQCPPKNYVPPLVILSRSADGAAAITGGYVYRGSAYPTMDGAYVFADFVNGNIYAYRDGNVGKVGSHPAITSFGQSQSRELFFVSFDGGLYRVAAS